MIVNFERVEWNESRRIPGGGIEMFLVIAERVNGRWEFYERSTWDILWCKTPATGTLIAKACDLSAEETLICANPA